jgi:hypothetical protein
MVLIPRKPTNEYKIKQSQSIMKIFSEYDLIIKLSILLFLLSWMSITDASAQQKYTTSTGVLNIKLQLNEKPVYINSHDLLILLNYETGRVIIKQKISDLFSDNDSLQALINGSEAEYIEFEGKLGLDYINTSGHPPLDFQVVGVILDYDYNVMGNGTIEHFIDNTSTSCILSMAFVIQLDEVAPAFKIDGLDNKIYIRIVQSLLARGSEK